MPTMINRRLRLFGTTTTTTTVSSSSSTLSVSGTDGKKERLSQQQQQQQQGHKYTNDDLLSTPTTTTLTPESSSASSSSSKEAASVSSALQSPPQRLRSCALLQRYNKSLTTTSSSHRNRGMKKDNQKKMNQRKAMTPSSSPSCATSLSSFTSDEETNSLIAAIHCPVVDQRSNMDEVMMNPLVPRFVRRLVDTDTGESMEIYSDGPDVSLESSSLDLSPTGTTTSTTTISLPSSSSVSSTTSQRVQSLNRLLSSSPTTPTMKTVGKFVLLSSQRFKIHVPITASTADLNSWIMSSRDRRGGGSRCSSSSIRSTGCPSTITKSPAWDENELRVSSSSSTSSSPLMMKTTTRVASMETIPNRDAMILYEYVNNDHDGGDDDESNHVNENGQMSSQQQRRRPCCILVATRTTITTKMNHHYQPDLVVDDDGDDDTSSITMTTSVYDYSIYECPIVISKSSSSCPNDSNDNIMDPNSLVDSVLGGGQGNGTTLIATIRAEEEQQSFPLVRSQKQVGQTSSMVTTTGAFQFKCTTHSTGGGEDRDRRCFVADQIRWSTLQGRAFCIHEERKVEPHPSTPSSSVESMMSQSTTTTRPSSSSSSSTTITLQRQPAARVTNLHPHERELLVFPAVDPILMMAFLAVMEEVILLSNL